jgi:uncharacterized protein YukE
MMSYTEQLEREAEQRRLHLSASLDELRARLSPGQVVNQLMDYVQDGSGGQFFHNLKRQVVGNPLPVTLIGAGVAWLVMARGRNGNGHGSSRRVHSAVGTAADSLAEARSGISAKMEAATSSFSDSAAAARTRLEEGRERLDEAVHSVRETAGETYSEVYNAATGAYERVSHKAGAMADSIRNLGRGTAQTGQSIAEFCRDQPLVVAGLGLAIGAALGAALPASELEDRVMGDASEDAKRKVREIASDTVDKVQAVGERAVDAARAAAYEEAETQGLTETGTETEDSRTADATATGDPDGDTVTVVPDPNPTQDSDVVPRTG